MEKKTIDLSRSRTEALMTQEQVAKFLGISVRTMEYWRTKNQGPKYIKLGKLVRYRPADLAAFIMSLLESEHGN